MYATPSELQKYPASTDGSGDVWLKDGAVYLSLAFVQKYTDMDIYTYENPSRIVIQHEFTGVNVASVQKNSCIRFRGGIKSPILTDVNKGDTVIYMQALEEWVQVSTMDGYIGYIQKEDISDPETKDFERDFQREDYSYLTMDAKVNIGCILSKIAKSIIENIVNLFVLQQLLSNNRFNFKFQSL